MNALSKEYYSQITKKTGIKLDLYLRNFKFEMLTKIISNIRIPNISLDARIIYSLMGEKRIFETCDLYN